MGIALGPACGPGMKEVRSRNEEDATRRPLRNAGPRDRAGAGSVRLRGLVLNGRQALHARRLALRHPVTGAPIEFIASAPADIASLLAAAGLKLPGIR